MRLTAPIFRLKHKAKRLARDTGIPLNAALDRIAKDEGFGNWSLLSSRASSEGPAMQLYNGLQPGDLVLLGARPAQGKTMMGLELISNTIKSGHEGYFFTLEYNEDEVLRRLQRVGGAKTAQRDGFQFDCSDAISADYIIDQVRDAKPGTLIVIDYLQLLDQKRDHPELKDQIVSLKAFAEKTGVIIVCISQIDRSYELTGRPLPDITDVRLPNPLDLGVFNKACFLHQGEVRVDVLN